MSPARAYLKLTQLLSRINRRLVEEKVSGRMAVLIHPEDYDNARHGGAAFDPVDEDWLVLGIKIIADEKAPRL